MKNRDIVEAATTSLKSLWDTETKQQARPMIGHPPRICPDCGERGEIRGHMTCQYPSDEAQT